MTLSNPSGTTGAAATAYVDALAALVGDDDPLDAMRVLVERLRAATTGLTDAELRRSERDGKWSIADVVEHLVDNETIVAWRVRSVLAHDEPAIAGFDQDRWAQRLHYGLAPLDTLLGELAVLRGRSLRLLSALSPEEFDRVGWHAERGAESVRRLAMITAGHDRAHLAQIARIRAAHDNAVS